MKKGTKEAWQKAKATLADGLGELEKEIDKARTRLDEDGKDAETDTEKGA